MIAARVRTCGPRSFLDLQDQLHRNICRRRKLVSMGTHDLDSVEGPFRYEALPPRDIKFVPLAQTREFDAAELMEFYETDASVKHIKPYVEIIKDSPVYPVVLDGQRRVMSLPPIINGELSKMSKDTRNIFIEVTATHLVKAKTVLNQLVRCLARVPAPRTSPPAPRTSARAHDNGGVRGVRHAGDVLLGVL